MENTPVNPQPLIPADEKTNNIDRRNFFQTRGFNLALKIFIALLAALLVFQLGMYVGFRKATFAFGWGDNYHRTFGGPQGGFMRDFTGRDFTNGHGVSGTIASVEGNNVIIKGADRVEKMIVIGDRTSIIGGRSNLKASDLMVGDTVTVIGKPGNDGTIQAEIIRVFGPVPPLPGMPLPLPRNH